MSFLVVDFGTSGCRAATVSESGAILSVSRVEHPAVNRSFSLDVEVAWQTLCAAVRLERTANPVSVDAVAVSSLLAYLFLDSQMEPVGPALSYADTSSVAQACALEAQPGYAERYRVTGRRARADLALPKLLRLRETDPTAFARVRYVHGLKDEFVRRMSGRLVTDYAHADYTLCFSPALRSFVGDLVSDVGLDTSLFASAVPATEIVGAVRSDSDGVLGLPNGTPVVAGSSDGTAAMYGIGVLGGHTVLMCGSTDVVMAASLTPVNDPQRILTVNSAMEGNGYLVGGATGTSGAALEHTARTLGVELLQTDSLADSVGAGADGLTALVGLTGERAPYWIDTPVAGLSGLTLSHGPAHIVRAVMEACAYRLRRLVSRLEAVNIPVSELFIAGGGARSDCWNRIRAGVLQKPLLRCTQSEATLFGTAMFCRAAVEPRVELHTLASTWVNTDSRFEPEVRDADRYNDGFDRYEKLLHAIPFGEGAGGQ